MENKQQEKIIWQKQKHVKNEQGEDQEKPVLG